ncbi:MAG TPA: bifunctional 5,10-methylenetetrahydrofolate dehydrogenase/5,10-methenyltetrahydrofolate cyclohydrolase [Candidatus Sulfotelmatobacter sp.]|nr:bifunctional 5,10-methylenetetrahydrofolate dehydrogenase/5,10-methenyltetrahydrofolate cyclohydrolase [Candidatus Sulfotelmatobacter sp.]
MHYVKYLNGLELSGYIKERQAKQVRALKQANGINPKLAIIVTIHDPVIEIYLRLKKKYGEEIGIEVELFRVEIEEVPELIKKLNSDDSIHGIIVQLPIANEERTEEIVDLVAPNKDVDGLAKKTDFDPATPLAILWLLAGYNVNLDGKNIVIVGKGRLVGAPLEKALKASGQNPIVLSRQSKDIADEVKNADVIITATGVPGLIKSDMIKQDAVVVDAGVASENGKTVGDVDEDVYDNRLDLTITPTKGGVGPLTVCALFDNLIRSANNFIKH